MFVFFHLKVDQLNYYRIDAFNGRKDDFVPVFLLSKRVEKNWLFIFIWLLMQLFGQVIHYYSNFSNCFMNVRYPVIMDHVYIPVYNNILYVQGATGLRKIGIFQFVNKQLFVGWNSRRLWMIYLGNVILISYTSYIFL